MNIPGITFRVKDPRGRTVWCSSRAWRHICLDHSDLATLRPLIEDVIHDPDVICSDADILDRECYYRFHARVHSVICDLKVVVEFGPSSDIFGGQVCTAYEKYDGVKQGEHKIWSRTTPRTP